MIDYYSNHEIGTKSDVWALGCFLYFICYFDLPYDDNKLAIVNAKYKTPNEHLLMFAPFLPVIRKLEIKLQAFNTIIIKTLQRVKSIF